jgi:putative acetyltransferase
MIHPVDPHCAGARRLLALSDAYMQALYPAESNHLESSAALAQPNVRFLGIHSGDELVACGAVKLMEDDGRYGEIKRVFVLPTHRGQGLARSIMAALEGILRREGFALARLETGVSQPEALALYRALGYAERPPFGRYAPDPLSLFMEKRLDEPPHG